MTSVPCFASLGRSFTLSSNTKRMVCAFRGVVTIYKKWHIGPMMEADQDLNKAQGDLFLPKSGECAP